MAAVHGGTVPRCLSTAVVVLLTLCLLQNARPISGAKILCASQQFGSHMAMLHTIGEELLERGHEVYTIYSDVMKVPPNLSKKGFKILHYHTPEGSETTGSAERAQSTMESALGLSGKELSIAEDSRIASWECRDMDNDAELMAAIEKIQFDLVLVDIYIPSYCMEFIPLKFNIPFISVSPSFDLEPMRVPYLPSFCPFVINEYSDNMSFKERFINLLTMVIVSIPSLSFSPSIKDTTLVQKYSKDPKVTNWAGVGRQAALYFISRGPLLEWPMPTMPHVINIEGLTAKDGGPLSPEIAVEIQANRNGIIVVSFGSQIRTLPDFMARKFLDAFATRRELIYWRYTGHLPGTVPANVKVMSWLPQNDLLAHPNTKLFITHSGNNGQYESIYHGVPMLAFPLFAEQFHNAHRIVDHGFGLRLDIKHFTSEELAQKMATIIDDKTFREKTQKRSRIFKSSPMDGRQTAVYWVEHVLAFGADHLRSHASDMPWYTYYMFDIAAFFCFIATVVLSGFMFVCCLVCKKCFRRQATKKVKTN